MTVFAGVNVVTADECDCECKNRPIAHDRLLRIEGMSVPYAALLVADLISGIDPEAGSPEFCRGNESVNSPES